MSCKKKLSPSLDEKLRDYFAREFPYIEDYDYTISDDGSEIIMTGKFSIPNSDDILEGIKDVEEMLDVTFLRITSVNEVYTFFYKFNE
jgi:hypothetical protein